MDKIFYAIAIVLVIAIIWIAMKGKKKGSNTPMNPPAPPTGGQGM